MIVKMTRFLSICGAVFIGVAGLWGCPRRQAPAVPATAVSPSPAPAGDALAAAVVAAVAGQLDLSPDQVLWDVPIARQPKAGDDVDVQEILNRLNEDQGRLCTLSSLRTVADAAPDQELAGIVTPQLLALTLVRAPFKAVVPLPDPNTPVEIPAEPE
jgi:hypothetical protein